MPKKQFKITDFSGGLNAYANPRDIQDTQFAQNWNASFDRYGIIRFTGAGVKYTTNHPHTNNNFIHGGGLFSFSTDISANVLDGTDLQQGFEKGTVQTYVDGATALTLAASPTYNSVGDHGTLDFYDNMILHIYSGPGQGQSSLITAYSTSQIATVTAFGLSDLTGAIPDGAASAAGIEGSTSENVAAVAKLRVYSEGSNTYHWGEGYVEGGSFLGSLFPWGIWTFIQSNYQNLAYVDLIANGINQVGIPMNNKALRIKDRDGKVLTIIFTNSGLDRLDDEFKFPTCTNASGTGTNHYDKVTTYQTTSTGGLAWQGNLIWTAGDRIFSSHTYEEYYLCNVQERTAAETTSDIAAIVNAENTGSGVNITATVSFDEDGNRTIITLTAQAGEATNSEGPQSLDVAMISEGYSDLYHSGEFNEPSDAGDTYAGIFGSGNRDAELEVFQNFTGGLGNVSTATITKITSTGHSVKVGEYITLRGTYGESDYDDSTFRVIWIEPNVIYVKSTLGDSSTADSCTFTTIPTTDSKYIIYNIGASGWDFEDSYQGNSIISNKSLSSTTTFSKTIG